MSYEDIVEERDGFRAKIVIDNDPQEPYNDGMSPIIRFERPAYEQVGGTSFKVPSKIEYAAADLDRDVFERYLRIFHGATDVQWWHSGDNLYVSFDTAEWRAAMGLDDEHMAFMRARDPRWSPVDMTEWQEYVNGNVFGVIVERAVSRDITIDDLQDARAGMADPVLFDDVVDAAVDAVRSSDDENDTTWTEIHAVWGYYGDDYAAQVAREELQNYITASANGDDSDMLGKAVPGL